MATIRAVLKKNKIKASGLIPIYLRIIEGEKNTFKSTGIDVRLDEWDEKNAKVRSKHPNSVRMNHLIAKKISELEDLRIQLDGKGGLGREVKALSNKKAKDQKLSFSKFFKEYVDQQKIDKKFGTHKKVESVLKKFNDYNKQSDVPFSIFTLEYLKEYENYLRGLGNTTNTIHANLKVFRMLFNKACQLEIIPIQNNPFNKHKLKTEKVEKSFLTQTEVDAIDQVKLTAGSKMEAHKDMFVFACYAGGIRISDLLQLRIERYDQTTKVISFFVHKTKNNHTIKLPKKAVEILERYISHGKNSGYIFGLLDESVFNASADLLLTKISSATAYANKNLKTVVDLAGIEKPISFHSSRHTFGTLAVKKGIGIQMVSKIMVHSNLTTTLGYSKIVDAQMWSEMDKMDGE
ncbi:tyrosine-type recombinase/integrase [Aquirufa sp.]|jgi:integrase/recombinase XerD|uniref:tyrosine-type recombinase/integrase n=1 Tax=Aquirufa sp. TaxID=2676249 RepID=UPI00378396AD